VPPADPPDPAVAAWDDGYNNGLDALLARAFGVSDGYRELNGILDSIDANLYEELGLADSPMLVVIPGLREMIESKGLERKSLEALFTALPGNFELRAWVEKYVPDLLPKVSPEAFEVAKPAYDRDRLERRVRALRRDLSALGPQLQLSAADKQVARDLINRLAGLNSYKNIHDALHDLQMRVMTEFARVASDKISGDERSASVSLQLQEMELIIDRIKGQFEDDGAVPAAIQGRDDVLASIRRIMDLISTRDPAERSTAETAAGLLRSLLRVQMSFFDSRLVEASEQIPFSKFAQTIASLNQPNIPKPEPKADPILLENVSNGIEGVAYRLNNRQRAHRLWQRTEAEILSIEELLGGTGREIEVGIHWDNIKALLNEIMPLSADLNIAKLLATTNMDLALSPDPAVVRSPAFRDAFMGFGRLARVFYQRADVALVDDCTQLRRLQDPLQLLL